MNRSESVPAVLAQLPMHRFASSPGFPLHTKFWLYAE